MENDSLKLLFATPLWEAQIGDERMNAQLKAAIYDVERNDTAFDSNKYRFGYTSYHSGLPLYRDIRFKEVTQRVLQQARLFLHAVRVRTPDGKRLSLQIIEIFCNINRKYSVHGAHRHECCDLSAVYYVDVPAGSAHFAANSPLEPLFMHSRSQLFEEDSPLTLEKHTVCPESGKLLIFPSWMAHEVEQQVTDGDRLSIAFNLGIVAKPREVEWNPDAVL